MIMWGCLIVAGIKHHGRTHKVKKSHNHKQRQQSLESVVKKVQQMEQLDRDDVVDERRGLYKFTVSGYCMDGNPCYS